MMKALRKIIITAMIGLLLGCCSQHWVSIPPSSRTRGQFHRVEKKETVYAISRKYNVPVRSIMDMNHLRPPYKLSIGQLLFIPPAHIHTVRKGDTLYSISRHYRVDLNSLARQNNLKEPWTLSVGQTLVLPTATLTQESSAQTKSTQTATKTAPNTAKTPISKPTVKTAQTKSPKTKAPTTKLPPTPKRTGNFIWPVEGKVISSYGPSGGGKHNDGINISAQRGTPVKAAENGVIAYAGSELKGFGNLLLIKHSDGWITAYAHADSVLVKRGQTVKKGQTIAKVGSTGNVKTPQLHFEIRKGTKALNPTSYLKGKK